MSITEREQRSAYDEGRRFRRAGKPKTACQKYDNTLRGRLLSDERESGWDDENRELLALAEARVRVPA